MKHINLSMAAAACLSLAVACASHLQMTRMHGQVRDDAPRIALLTSGNNRLTQAVIKSLVSHVEAPVAEFSITTDVSPGRVERAIRTLAPSVVIALGGRAASIMKTHLYDFPTLYGLVSLSQLRGLVGDGTAGVALETSVPTEFSLYRAVVPTLHRVTTFYRSTHPPELVSKVRQELQAINIELIALQADSPEELLRVRREHTNVGDALWINDPTMLNAHSFKTMAEAMIAQKQLLLCSSLREFATAGAVVVVDVDFANVGAQLAQMSDDIAIHGRSLSDMGLRSPIGGKLIVNLDTASRVGVEVPARVRPFISEIIESTSP